MKVRLGESMKLLAILGLGLGVTRWAMLDQARRLVPQPSEIGGAAGPFTRKWLGLLVTNHLRPTLSGIALVAGIAIMFDRASRRPPRGWGEGRWLLAAWSATLSFKFGYHTIVSGMELYRRSLIPLPINRTIVSGMISRSKGTLSRSIEHGVVTQAVLGLLAGWFALRLGRLARDPSPDVTEWAGRATCLLMILSTLIYDLTL